MPLPKRSNSIHNSHTHTHARANNIFYVIFFSISFVEKYVPNIFIINILLYYIYLFMFYSILNLSLFISTNFRLHHSYICVPIVFLCECFCTVLVLDVCISFSTSQYMCCVCHCGSVLCMFEFAFALECEISVFQAKVHATLEGYGHNGYNDNISNAGRVRHTDTQPHSFAGWRCLCSNF